MDKSTTFTMSIISSTILGSQQVRVGAKQEISLEIAARIDELIRKKAGKGEEVVLGLATGSSPLLIYAELVRRHREEGLSFSNLVSFYLYEY